MLRQHKAPDYFARKTEPAEGAVKWPEWGAKPEATDLELELPLSAATDSGDLIRMHMPPKRTCSGHRTCGLIAIEAGRSPPTINGRSTCDSKRQARSSPSTHRASKSAIMAGGLAP